MNKPIAVIILNWNGERLLREFLPSVVDCNDDAIADVIVADNGSTDGSIGLLKTSFPSVRILEFPENYGFAEGYNRAVDATRYPYTLLLNSDVKVTPGWLDPLYRWAIDHPDMGAIQPKILSYTDPSRFEYAGASGGFLDRNGYPYCRGRIFSTVEKDNRQYDDPCEIFWASGAAMLVDTRAYLSVGGLDSRFFAHMEEIDLCWRLQLIGRRNYVVPRSVVYHLGGGSLPADNPRKTYLNFRNNLLMLHKNLPDTCRTRRLFTRRLLDSMAWAMFIVTGKWSHARAVIRAHRDFRHMRRDYTSHPSVDLMRRDPCSRRNIITSYYLRRRKTF